MKYCPFCDPKQSYRCLAEKKLAKVLFAKQPACRYHALIVPKRHIKTVNQLTSVEWNEFLELIKLFDTCMQQLDGYLGYNLLSNNGDPLIRQQVSHCHMHMFLRVGGDNGDPLISKHSSSVDELTAGELANMQKLKQLLLQSEESTVTME